MTTKGKKVEVKQICLVSPKAYLTQSGRASKTWIWSNLFASYE